MRTLVPSDRYRLGLALLAAGLVANPWLVGFLLTEDGSIDQIGHFAAILAFDALCTLGGLQLMWRWVEPLAWGGPVGFLRGAAFVGFFAFVIAGTYWGIATFNRGHDHTIIIPAELERATPEQRQWARDFYRASLAAALEHGWFDFDTAMQQGFQPDRINRTHFPNLEYMFDDVILDPERPEWLVYHDSPNGKVLMALMFFTRELDEKGPTPGGPLAQWHYHPYERTRCAIEGLWTVGDADANGECEEGIPVTYTPEMLHVWFMDHPLGHFTEMKLVSDYWQDGQNSVKLWHPVAVHFVIALFIVSVLLDVVGRIASKPAYHHAGWINLALAAIAAVAAVALGMTAEVFSKPTPEGHQTLDVHKLLAFASLALILVLFTWRYALRGAFPRTGALLYLVIALTGVGVISGAGYFGGQMVYEHGTGVSLVDRFLRERYWHEVETIYKQPDDAMFKASNLE